MSGEAAAPPLRAIARTDMKTAGQCKVPGENCRTKFRARVRTRDGDVIPACPKHAAELLRVDSAVLDRALGLWGRRS